MWQAERSALQNGVQQLTLRRGARSLTMAEVCRLWQADDGFCAFFSGALAEAPYAAVFWELPPLTERNLHRPFECILADAPQLARMAPEPEVFAAPFAAAGPGALVASFPNLGGDATLIAPCPDAAAGPYPHLAAFCRRAPKRQLLAFWKAVGEALADSLSARPLWLSTSGLGVAWLHARLDSTPKYYTHAPYRSLG